MRRSAVVFARLISAFIFAQYIVQCFFLINLKLQASTYCFVSDLVGNPDFFHALKAHIESEGVLVSMVITFTEGLTDVSSLHCALFEGIYAFEFMNKLFFFFEFATQNLKKTTADGRKISKYYGIHPKVMLDNLGILFKRKKMIVWKKNSERDIAFVGEKHKSISLALIRH